jgi:hypothetical protein
MKTRKSHEVIPIQKRPSPVEQELLLMARRHRTGYRRQTKRLQALGNAAKHGLFIVVCAGGLLAASTAIAAAAPSTASAPALFNEANAAQRAGRLGPAILDYERARLLAPHDRFIAQNLRAARQKAGVTAPFVPVWQRPAHWLSFNGFAALASISLLLFSLLFFGMGLIPTTLGGLARGGAASLGVLTLLAVAAVAVRWPELDRAVIIGAKPVAHIAPALNAAAPFELKTGEIVQTEDTYGDFVRIRAADGRSGWVRAADVDRIIPTAL